MNNTVPVTFVSLIGLGIYLILAARSLLTDVWKLTLISELADRNRAALVCFCLCGFPIVVLAIITFGPEHLTTAIFLMVTIAPAAAWQLLVHWAWHTDSRDIRGAALAIAVERARGSMEPVPSLEQRWPWTDYLYDVETARRREKYEPPPI